MDIVSVVLVTALTISITSGSSISSGSASSLPVTYQHPELHSTSPTSSAPLSPSASPSSSSSFNETSTASGSSNHTSSGFPYDYNYGYDTVGTECDYSEWNVTPTLIPIVYSLVFVCGLVGNGLVVWTIARLKTRKRNTDLYIASLASADLVFVLTLPLWAAYTALDYHWPFGGFLCTLSSCVSMLNMYASIFCLTCLSLDRYVAVVCSLRSHSFRTARVTKALLAGVWTFSSLMALFTAALATTKTIAEDRADADDVSYDDDDGYGASGGRVVCVVEYSSLGSNGEMSPDWWNAMAGLFHTSASFVLPEVVMIYCYACIMAKIQNHFTHVRRESDKRRRLLRTIFNLVLTFTVCWLPFHAVKVTNALVHFGVLPTRCGLERFIFVGLPYTVSLAYVNSCLNPFLYAYFDPHFRSTCLGVLRCATLEALMAAQVSSAGGSGAATASRDEPSSRSDTPDACGGGAAKESNASDAVAALCCGRFLAPPGARAHTETETSDLRKSPTRFQHESPLRGDK
ncbi:apelin receptor A-like [Lampetra fluviatilis]